MSSIELKIRKILDASANKQLPSKFVHENYDSLLQMKLKGYTYVQLMQFLSGIGVHISADSLRMLMGRIRAKRGKPSVVAERTQRKATALVASFFREYKKAGYSEDMLCKGFDSWKNRFRK